MELDIDRLIKDYKENISSSKKYFSYINQVREYNGYIFKEINDLKKFNNESKWLNKLMDMWYFTPKVYGTYENKIIVMEKINANAINDEKAHEHLYNIGKLIGNLHHLPIDEKSNWKDIIFNEYIEIKKSVENLMESNLYNKATSFIENGFKTLEFSEISIVHRDLRPENVLYSNNKYYLIDLESMCVGDRDYDFTRMFNLFNQFDNIYTYEDFKMFLNGYRSIHEINLSENKWRFYNKYYAFRIYARMLSGKINRSNTYEEYLIKVLDDEKDRVFEWIKKYNQNELCGKV